MDIWQKKIGLIYTASEQQIPFHLLERIVDTKIQFDL